MYPNNRYSCESTIVGRINPSIRVNQHGRFVLSRFVTLHQNTTLLLLCDYIVFRSFLMKKVNATEALERKKRIAGKGQIRTELSARKAPEEKEKIFRLPVHWDKTAIVVTDEVRVSEAHMFLAGFGIDEEILRFRQHFPNEMAHYATDG
ncbi:hypothetical protein Tco_0852906 [Tanacetum coccineum]